MAVYKINDLGHNTPCKTCPETDTASGYKKGAHCRGGYFAPYAKPGFWAQASSPLQFFKCFKGVCTGGRAFGGMQGQRITLQTCAKGAKGIMCSSCEFNHFKRGKACNACPPASCGWLIYLIMPMVTQPSSSLNLLIPSPAR